MIGLPKFQFEVHFQWKIFFALLYVHCSSILTRCFSLDLTSSLKINCALFFSSFRNEWKMKASKSHNFFFDSFHSSKAKSHVLSSQFSFFVEFLCSKFQSFTPNDRLSNAQSYRIYCLVHAITILYIMDLYVCSVIHYTDIQQFYMNGYATDKLSSWKTIHAEISKILKLGHFIGLYLSIHSTLYV